MPTTEIARIPLKAGSEIGDPNNHASGTLNGLLNGISQQDGFQQQYFGMEMENPNTLQLLIDWDSKKKHEDFMASEQYKPFSEGFGTIMDGAPNLIHVDFSPEGGVKRATGQPVTEVATFYFDGAPPEDAVESVTKFIDVCQKESGQTVAGWAYGITHEEIEKDGVKGKGGVLLIGWESREAHMAFRELDTFKKNRPLLAQTTKGVEVHHTPFMNHIAS